ncbi:MAG: ABC transporter substrate-binding protein, partial [Pseudolabrys sp.]
MALSLRALACALALSAAFAGTGKAEVNELTVAQQYGVSFLPLMMMEKNKLIEKHAAASGLSGLKVSWAKVAGPAA